MCNKKLKLLYTIKFIIITIFTLIMLNSELNFYDSLIIKKNYS